MAVRIRWGRFLSNLLILLSLAGFLFLSSMSSWLAPAGAGSYQQAMARYFYGELAYSLLTAALLMMLFRFTRWLLERAKNHPPSRRRQQRRFKNWVWTSVLLILITVYFSSILWMETYYAYLDSHGFQELRGAYIGVTGGQVRVSIDNTPVSLPLLDSPSPTLHFGDPVVVFKGPKTGRVTVDKIPEQ